MSLQGVGIKGSLKASFSLPFGIIPILKWDLKSMMKKKCFMGIDSYCGFLSLERSKVFVIDLLKKTVRQPYLKNKITVTAKGVRINFNVLLLV